MAVNGATGEVQPFIDDSMLDKAGPPEVSKRVIIESPYGAADATGVAANVAYLQRCIRHAVLVCGESPYASHQMLTQALDDRNTSERNAGIEAGFLWRYAAAAEIAKALELSVDVVRLAAIGSTYKWVKASAVETEAAPASGRERPPHRRRAPRRCRLTRGRGRRP